MNLWGVTDIGAVRNDNQDSYRMERLDEHTALAVVCDGMGGARAGNVASSTAVERFTQTLIEQHPQAGWLGRARCAMRVARANEEVYSISQDRPECRGMGTTLVAALATEETLWVVNIGDSRCYQVHVARSGALPGTTLLWKTWWSREKLPGNRLGCILKRI